MEVLQIFFQVYEYDFYGVNPETEMIDYDQLEKRRKNLNPLIIAGAVHIRG